MLVSVIIPVYGTEKYIDRCARSLLTQTWDELELIFVNDGTTDKAVEVLKRTLEDYPQRKVTLIEQANAGLPQARLKGLRNAKGEYILHVDSDDWVEPTMVEKLAQAAMETHADMVYCQAWKEFGDGRRRIVHDRSYDDCPSYARAMLRFKAHGYVWNKLIRKSLMREDFFYPVIGMHEDMVLLSQVLGSGGRCTCVPEPLYHYRRDNLTSISNQQKDKRDVDSARNFLQLCAFWEDRSDSPLRESLPGILVRCGWIASRLAPELADEFPFLRGKLLLMPRRAVSGPKQWLRLHKAKKWLRSRPFHSRRILCCIFNYNENEKAIQWSENLSPCFDTLILDSGSQPRCGHPTAVHLDNIYYSGLMNEAYRRAQEGDYPWVMILTSDLEISEKMVHPLRLRMEAISYTENVGLYQPGNAFWGNSHSRSKARITGGIRSTNFQEGWFHLMRTDLMGKICPIDLNINRLGWGVDMALSYFANREGLRILVDSDVTVLHPSGTGYNRDEAQRQMNAWLQTIPGYEDPFHMKKAK